MLGAVKRSLSPLKALESFHRFAQVMILYSFCIIVHSYNLRRVLRYKLCHDHDPKALCD